MARVDFWWDAPDSRIAPNFNVLLREFLTWRPTARPPTLAIVGSMRLFQGSALHKAIRKTELLHVIPFEELTDEEIAHPNVALIRWGSMAPAHRERLPTGVRALNDTHLDTDKANVEEKFSAVAGYGSFLDPEAAEGLVVVKSRMNARHDGQV